MKGIEPATCLVYTFGNEIGRVYRTAVEQLLILKRIVYLSVWHSTRIEPHINEIEFAFHNLACGRHKLYIIDVWAVQVYLVVVFLAVIARNKAFILVWVALHYTGSNRLFYFIVQFGNRANAYSLTIFASPYRQWSTPVTAAAQVPVIEIFEPLAETACTGRFRFPDDSLVEFAHTLLHLRSTHEPAVEWVIEHRLVCTPAVRIIMHVLFYLERKPLLLKNHT